jgi:hypothetical protein
MSGSSGTNTVTQTIPDWMQNYISNTYNTAQNVANTPYQGFTGQGVAPLNSTETSGLTQLANAGAANTGATAINSGVNAATGASQYTPTQVGYTAPTAADIQQYMSPYINNAVNTSNQQIEQAGQIGNQQIAGSATSAGAYGGARQGVEEALNNKYTEQNVAENTANLENSAYSTALGQANTNAQSNLNAATTNAANGLTANQQAITGGMVLGQLGGEQATNAQSNANAVYTAGQAGQTTQQAADTYAYNQYLQQLMWPYQQLSALEGATYQGNAGSSTTSPTYSNTLGQVAGLGMAGLGLAGSLGLLGSSGGAAAGGTALADSALMALA